MRVCVAFCRNADTFLKSVVQACVGPYVHTSLLITVGHTTLVYTTRTGGHYACGTADSLTDDAYDYLQVPAAPESVAYMLRLCQALADTRVPYNTRDMVLAPVPFREPADHGIYQAPTLYCAQAATLVLRECLPGGTDLHNALRQLNSRTVTPTDLYHALAPFCTPANSRLVTQSCPT